MALLIPLLRTYRDTVCIDEVDLLGAHAKDALTGLVLVDHNKLTASLQNLGPVGDRGRALFPRGYFLLYLSVS